MNWNQYFLQMIQTIRLKSKDPNTQIGCVIVGPDKEVRSTGYNSFPRNLNDNVPARLERPEKYFWIEHAERNAIYNAARVGIPLKDCSIYMQILPCTDCARAIIQSGISKIIYNHDEWLKFQSEHYNSEVLDRSIEMLKECGVEIVPISILGEGK